MGLWAISLSKPGIQSVCTDVFKMLGGGNCRLKILNRVKFTFKAEGHVGWGGKLCSTHTKEATGQNCEFKVS